MTSKIQRQPRRDPTPAPLPPSPGARDAERWFEQVPTNPAAQGLDPRDTTGSTGRQRAPSSSVHTNPAAPAPRPMVLIALIAAIALTIGMILGALLFGHSGATKCEPCTNAATPHVP